MDGETRDRDALLAHLEDDARAAMDAAEHGALAGAEDLAGRVLDVARSMEPSPRLDRCLSRALRACGTAQRARGRYGAAERSFEHALASATSGFGGITVEVAELLNDLGMTYKFDGRFELAEAAYARASTLLSTLPGVDPQDAAALLHNLAGLAHARGDLITA